MQQDLARLVRLVPTLMVLSIYAPDAVLARGPCRPILATCEQAGFVRGGAPTGNGLQIDCVRPIMPERLSALGPPSLCRKSMLKSSPLARRETQTSASVEHRLHLTVGSRAPAH
jgi:hypothetical protein